jgi:hypothetical protein
MATVSGKPTGGFAQEMLSLLRLSSAWVRTLQLHHDNVSLLFDVASRALAVVTDKEEVLTYSLPHLELITRFKQLPLDGG